MGNIEAHDFAPVRPDERKELNLSRKPTYKQFLKHLDGEMHEACLRELPYSLRDSISLYEIMKVAFNALSESDKFGRIRTMPPKPRKPTYALGFQQLPPELPLRLPHLRYLDLSYNQLEELPCSFGLLFHLQTLLIQHNKLRALPPTFTRLVKLQKLDLSNNVLRELPDDIGEMENLTLLAVSRNKLKHLPLSLGSAPKLTVLLADKNRLDSPPQAVCNEGSASTIQFLRKQFAASQDRNPPRPLTPLNEFPRNRSNQLHSPVSNPQSAHMQYIQEQTHTTNTPSRIKAPLMPPLDSSSFDALELRDRILGLIYGAAIGDVMGLATRWMSADQCSFHYGDKSSMLSFTNIVQDHHRILWRQGDWTSNFDCFMLVLESVINWGGVVDELDFAKRLSTWAHNGFQELGDTVGIVTSSTITQVLAEKNYTTRPHGASSTVLQRHGNPENGVVPHDAGTGDAKLRPGRTSSIDASCSGPIKVQEESSSSEFGTDNGAVIRTAILGVPSFHNLDEVEENCVRICRATHADPRCIASCVFVSILVATILQGKLNSVDKGPASWESVVDSARERALPFLTDPKHKEQFVSRLKVNSIKQLRAREKNEMSHTYKPVSAAVLALQWDRTFRDFIMELSMEGGDSNSNCCVGGAIIGLRTGYKRLPSAWVQGLRPRQLTWLNLRINHLLDMMGLP